ncbi:MAG TPA: superoxide dismutase [Xanthomonadales bacterium]|nr:superoxide dismutase [Xanthomonadales bacterium]
MSFDLKPLPYEQNALAPVISAETLSYHYGKHHRGYVNKLNAALEDSSATDVTLESLIQDAEGGLFNNAAQIWNHDFYWASLSPQGGGDPDGELKKALVDAFGSVDAFRKDFAQAAKGQFGSGWAWLVSDSNDCLSIQSTPDAENPLREGFKPLLTLDVWEHAYYLDYQNERAKYVDACIEHLLDWDHAARCYASG